MSSNFSTYNSSFLSDSFKNGGATPNASIKNSLQESAEQLEALYLTYVKRMMWIYLSPILLLIGTTGNVVSAMIMLRYAP